MPSVSVSAVTSTQIVAPDYNRILIVITNSDATAKCHINFGGTATTNDAYIGPGGNMTIAGDHLWMGAINGISSSGTITVKYSSASPGT